MELTYSITSGSSGLNIFDHQNGDYLFENGQLKEWGSEKTAIQYLRREARKTGARITIQHPSGKLGIDASPQPNYGRHHWRKANVMDLYDQRGHYDKLVCIYCKRIVRRYRNQRWNDLDFCPENIVGYQEAA